MKVNELNKKYKDYDIILYGENSYYKTAKQCRKKSIPFSFIRTFNRKEIDKLEVIDLYIEEKEFEAPHFTLSGEYKYTEKYKGTVYALIEKGVK